MVIGVRRQSVGEIDAPAIKKFAVRRDRDELCRIAVLGNADGRAWLGSLFRHVFLVTD